MTANWIITELLRSINKNYVTIKKSNIRPCQLGELITIVSKNIISNKMAKNAFEIMWKKNIDPKLIIKKYNFKKIEKHKIIYKNVDQIIASHPRQTKDYKGGKKKIFAFFIGKIMQISKNKINPEKISKILKLKLKITKTIPVTNLT